MNFRGSRCVWITRASGYSANTCGSVGRWPGDFNSQRFGSVVVLAVLERLQHAAVQAVHAVEGLEVLELPAHALGVSYSIDQYGPAKSYARKCTHSHGRSLASSCIVMNSGWMSAQNSCSHSASRPPAGDVVRVVPAGRAAARALPTRAAGAAAGRARAARAGSSCPSAADRRRTAARRSARRRSRVRRCHAAWSRSQVCRMRSTSAAGDDPAEQVQLGLLVDRGELATVGLLPARPLRLPGVGEAGRGACAPRAARRDRGRRRGRGSPTTAPNRLRRRTQSGCTSSFVMLEEWHFSSRAIDKGEHAPWPTPSLHPPTSPPSPHDVFDYVRRPANHADDQWRRDGAGRAERARGARSRGQVRHEHEARHPLPGHVEGRRVRRRHAHRVVPPRRPPLAVGGRARR